VALAATSAFTTAEARALESVTLNSVVRVTYDPDAERWTVLEQFRDLLQCGLRLGLDLGLVKVEEDALNLNVAALGQPALERVGVGHHVLVHRLPLHNREVVAQAATGLEFGPGFAAVPGDQKRGPVVAAVETLGPARHQEIPS